MEAQSPTKFHSYLDEEDSLRTKERIKTQVFPDSAQASKWAAKEIAQLIRKRADYNKPCILGLATGNTPIGIYRELRRMHEEENLSFKNVITFNLDEYYPIQKEALQSYWRFMHENLFNHVDILPENINIPDGQINKNEVDHFCKQYEKKIQKMGGIDLQILGIGRTGHIGFNEPLSSVKSTTRIINLDKITRTDAASDFYGVHKVPKTAITMGIQTIMGSKRIILLAFSENKAKVIRRAIEEEVNPEIPASYLQLHRQVDCVIDKSAAAKLTRYQAPWTIKGVNTDPNLVFDKYWAIKAVIWLCKKVQKPILRLIEQDYEENGLMELIQQQGNGEVGQVNLKVFTWIQDKITGWPAGGRPDKQSENYFTQTKSTSSKNILIFSPHPDDDVICMGATMSKLCSQGHDVHVAYQTSGNIAVFDHDAIKSNDFVKEFVKIFFEDDAEVSKKVIDKCEYLENVLEKKDPNEADPWDVRHLKTLVRRTEARTAAHTTGVDRKKIYSLDLPFYESGKIQKKPLGQEDISIVYDLIKKLDPQIIYAAGDLTDPHGTHRVCLQTILAAIKQFQEETKGQFLETKKVYLYRGAWQEWELELVDIVVPMSPEELERKKKAIFKHQSQKDKAMFPGSDNREFWQRAEFRNKQSAETFKHLGLHQFEALECFVDLLTLKDQNAL